MLAHRVLKNWDNEEIISDTILKVSENIMRLNELINNTFEKYCITQVFRLNFHLFYHVVEDVESFGSHNIFSASQFERYNVHIKNTNRFIPQRQKSGVEETERVLKYNEQYAEANLEYRRSGECQRVGQNENQITGSEIFVFRYVVRTTVRKLQKAGRGEVLVGREINVATGMVKFFRKIQYIQCQV